LGGGTTRSAAAVLHVPDRRPRPLSNLARAGAGYEAYNVYSMTLVPLRLPPKVPRVLCR